MPDGHPVDANAADRSRRLIGTLTLTVLLQWMGATAIVPMLPIYIRHLGGTDALAGLVMASFFAAGVISQYPIGRIADVVRRCALCMWRRWRGRSWKPALGA